MSWLGEVLGLAKRIVLLEDQIKNNAREVQQLRQDIQALTQFTYKVANVVKHDRAEYKYKEENLILKLRLELSDLERRLTDSGSSQQSLPENNIDT